MEISRIFILGTSRKSPEKETRNPGRLQKIGSQKEDFHL
jgi:hypothetical protein